MLAEKKPRFGAIEETSLKRAAEFGAALLEPIASRLHGKCLL